MLTAQQMLQDSKTKIDIIRMQLRRALQAGQLESQAAPEEAQGEAFPFILPAHTQTSPINALLCTARRRELISR